MSGDKQREHLILTGAETRNGLTIYWLGTEAKPKDMGICFDGEFFNIARQEAAESVALALAMASADVENALGNDEPKTPPICAGLERRQRYQYWPIRVGWHRCDSHAFLFWQSRPQRPGATAATALGWTLHIGPVQIYFGDSLWSDDFVAEPAANGAAPRTHSARPD